MRILIEVLIDESQWPEDRLEQLKFNLVTGVGAAKEQTTWYRNDIDPDYEYKLTVEI